MDADLALNIVYDCLLGENSIPQKLRFRDGLDDNRFAQLEQAIRLLVAYYAKDELVPKRSASCMVDIYASFSFQDGFYSEEESARIEDAGMILQELAYELFGGKDL